MRDAFFLLGKGRYNGLVSGIIYRKGFFLKYDNPLCYGLFCIIINYISYYTRTEVTYENKNH